MRKSIRYAVAAAILFCVSVISCRNSSTDSDVQIIPVRFDKYEKVAMSDIISKIEVIEMDNDTLALMGDPGTVRVENNHYYIIDDAVHSILVFDSTGHFMCNTISRRGRGHNEHINPNDYYVENGLICIMDYDGTILKYDLSLNMVQKIKPTLKEAGYCSDAIPLTDDILAFKSPFCCYFYSISKDSVIGKYETSDIRGGGFAFQRQRYFQNDSLVLFRFTNNGYSLYMVDKDDLTVKEAYRYTVNQDMFDMSKVDEQTNIRDYIKEKNYDFCLLGEMNINNRYLISTIGYLRQEEDDWLDYILKANKYRLSIYSFENDRHRLLDKVFKDDKFILNFTYMDNEAIYTIIDPGMGELDRFLPHLYDENLMDPDSRQRIEHVNDDTNCIIIKYYLRDDIL